MSQKTGENGCWILASQGVGVLDRHVFWTIDVFASTELADRAKGPNSIVL